MTTRLLCTLWFIVLLASCARSPEISKRPERSAEMKEMLFRRGHQLFLEQKFDSAAIVLERSIAMDERYTAPLANLAEMYYLIGVREGGDKQPKYVEGFMKSRQYYARVEALGSKESNVLERLCELSDVMEDDTAFVLYAKKNAAAFPSDRQYFNLGFAYFKAGDYANAIASQKEAVEKFEDSPYIGSFYRQLGRAYMKIDRDQTAERNFVAGVQKVDSRIKEISKAGGDYKSSGEYHRLMDDKIGMLTSLRSLHVTYKANDKLEQVERELKEANENK